MTNLKNASKMSMYSTAQLKRFADLLLKRASHRTNLDNKTADLQDAQAYMEAARLRSVGRLADNSTAHVLKNKNRLSKYADDELFDFGTLLLERATHRDTKEGAVEDVKAALDYLMAYKARMDGDLEDNS